MKEKRKCVTCKWCYKDELGDFVCVNGDSEYCSDYVDKTHSCDDWEDKIENDR